MVTHSVWNYACFILISTVKIFISDDYLSYACGMISEYLEEKLAQVLSDSYKFAIIDFFVLLTV